MDVFRLQECINDVCEDTLQIDKLYLLLLENSNANTAFGTQIGPPEEKTQNVIMQINLPEADPGVLFPFLFVIVHSKY